MIQHPLAYRMRPKNIEEIVGQTQLVSENQIIWRMVQAGRLSSMILYGPPGTGKTSIASAIAGSTNFSFRTLNAATDGQKELQTVVEEAKISGNIVLLLDEIHRLNKVKQDFLLPYLESGQIIVIGATTENPYINVTPAIRSRMQIFEVFSLSANDIKIAINRALSDEENGLGKFNVKIKEESINFLANSTNGDLRSALNALELAVLSTKAKKGIISISTEDLENSVQRKSISGDKDGDAHYDVISAFQKSIRGSDADAALHYLARILETGDLVIAARRLLVIAYEDIGLANPAAAARAANAVDAAMQLGLPEARIPLANAVIELALSPKSNSAYSAINDALDDVRTISHLDVPKHLKDAHYKGAEKLGHGVEYIYPHNYENDWYPQQYLPDKLLKTKYFQPKGNSQYEITLKEINEKLKLNQSRDKNKNNRK